MRRLVAVVLAVCGLGIVAGAAAAATPQVITGGGTAKDARFQTRPYQIVYSGDGAAFLAGTRSTRAHLAWSRWTGRGGRGTGADWRDDCVPDCARGRYHPYRVTVTVDRPRTIAGRRLFTRMRVVYLRGRPRDSRRHGGVLSFSLSVRRGLYYWN